MFEAENTRPRSLEHGEAVSNVQTSSFRLFKRLTAQRREVDCAFDLLLQQIQRTCAVSRADHVSVACGTPADPFVEELTKTVTMLDTEFRFLFERVHLHQLESTVEFADSLAVPEGSGEPLAAALRSLRRTPLRTQREQARNMASVALMRGAPLEHATTLLSSSGTQSEVAPQAALALFAVSPRMGEQGTQEAIRIITGLHCPAVVLPIGAQEEQFAFTIGCRCLVSPQPSPARLLPVISLEQLRTFTTRRLSAALPHQPEPAAEDAELAELLAMLDSSTDDTPVPLPHALGLEEGEREPECGASSSSPTLATLTRETLRGTLSQPTTKRRRSTAHALSEVLRGSGDSDCADSEYRRWTGSAHLHNRAETPELDFTQAAVSQSQGVRYVREGHADGRSDEQERALLAVRPPHTWVFQISNSVRELKPTLIEAIQKLGAAVDLSSQYSEASTHLVVAEGITERTEKYLGTCAAGKFIVPPRYVLTCAERGRWLVGSMDEYNSNPRLRLPGRLDHSLFAHWRVAVLASHVGVARGISAVLRAGGCTDAQIFVFDENSTADVPVRTEEFTAPVEASPSGVTTGLDARSTLSADFLRTRTHLLLECRQISLLSPEGHFQVPPWLPTSLMRSALYPRLFTLELLYYVLCTSSEPVFDDAGSLIAEDRISGACRVEPFQ